MLKKYFDLISKDRVCLFKIKDKLPFSNNGEDGAVEALLSVGPYFKGNEKYIRFGKTTHSSDLEIWYKDGTYKNIKPYADEAIQLENLFREEFDL
jgi:hypothetical protein